MPNTSNYYLCDPNSILIASNCFLDPNIGVEQRRAIEIFARVQELQALRNLEGFPLPTIDYSLSIAGLLTAAGKWRLLSANQREAISTYFTVEDSLRNNAVFSTNINSLKKNSACYLAIGENDKKNLLSFLRCAIGFYNVNEGGE